MPPAVGSPRAGKARAGLSGAGRGGVNFHGPTAAAGVASCGHRGRAERFADESRISEEVNLRYEYPLRQECLDEITVEGMGTGGLTLKEYDDLLFGEMLPGPDSPVDTSL